MKIIKLKTYKNKLTKVNLINTKIFDKKILNEDINIDEIKYQLKKSLQVIYKYHFNNKKILFIGGVVPRILKQIKNSKHTWISEYNWLNGFLTNKNFVNSSNQNPRKNRIKFQKNYNLIVILSDENSSILKESYSNKIPTICLNVETDLFNDTYSYKISGNFRFTQKYIKENFFYKILETTLKRANCIKKYSEKNKKHAIQKKKQIQTSLQNSYKTNRKRFK